MARGKFDTTVRRNVSRRPGSGLLARYRPQIVVCLLVVAALAGGALYSARISEKALQVVYNVSLEDISKQAQKPLVVDINSADEKTLDELPGVGPATAQSIIEYRQGKGPFRSVDDLEEVTGIGPATLEEIRPFAAVR